ncbi:ATP:ADP antiporter, AAA family [Alphaproteobacteria bacterium]
MHLIKRLFSLSKIEQQKLKITGLLFFCIIASYTIAKELQHIIFNVAVGITHMPFAKLLIMLLLLPLLFVDGMLVDRFRRDQILMLYLTIFSFTGLTFCYLLGTGDVQAHVSPIIGWLFFLYVEGYVVFILGVFWAFANSIHNPQHAEHTYGFIVSISKLGGIFSGGFAYLFLSTRLSENFKDIDKLRVLLCISSAMLGIAALFLYTQLKKVKKNVLQGYCTNICEKIEKTGAAAGLKLMIKQPYILGIFFIIFSYEVMVEVINYQRLLVVMPGKAAAVGESISAIGTALYCQSMTMQALACILSFFIANGMLRFLGIRTSLFIMPIFVFCILAAYFASGVQQIFVFLYIVLHALNYGVNTPIREGLYIVASRDIQLKSKFIVDGLAVKTGRCTGQLFNIGVSKVLMHAQYGSIAFATNTFFICGLSIWFIVCTAVGKRYAKAIRQNELIG